jgi:hypothetical protein
LKGQATWYLVNRSFHAENRQRFSTLQEFIHNLYVYEMCTSCGRA